MSEGIGVLIEEGVLGVLNRSCQSHQFENATCGAVLPGEDGTLGLELLLGTTCTATNVFRLILLIAVTIGSGIICCTCSAVACRCMYRIYWFR